IIYKQRDFPFRGPGVFLEFPDLIQGRCSMMITKYGKRNHFMRNCPVVRRHRAHMYSAPWKSWGERFMEWVDESTRAMYTSGDTVYMERRRKPCPHCLLRSRV